MWKFAVCALALTVPAHAQTAADFAAQAEGRWSSAEQSASAAYDYVYSETVRIWPERTDGVWVYQQNWVIGPNTSEVPRYSVRLSEAPYFQVVIQLRDFGDGEVHSTTYRLSGAEAREGAWYVRPGSDVAFDEAWLGEVACMGRQQAIAPGFWEGAANCPNGYKGGVRVDSRSIRTPDTYVNWDRGFDADCNHIWGPAGGGYIFKRMEDGE